MIQAHHSTANPPTDVRERFLHLSLCQAQVEFSRLESPPKVIESGLLTAMGTLGAVRGFSAWHQSDADAINMLGRGVDHPALTSIEANFQRLVDRCFTAWRTAPYPFHTDVQILFDPPGIPELPETARIVVLIGWRIAEQMTGLMGLGATIRDAPFVESEIGFLIRLVDQMMAAIRAIAANSVIHTLNNELELARQRSAESATRNEAAKKELEETQFRLSAFNDIFQELSGLTESVKVLDAFLLVMLGIFSAQDGAILFADDTSGSARAVMRGVDAATTWDERPAEIRETLEALFNSRSGSRLAVMQAAVLPLEQVIGLDRLFLRGGVAVLFKADFSTRGVLYMGKRLVEAQYGAKEQELLLAFTHIFLAFLKNSKSFETITRLHADQQQKTIELEKTVQALSESRRTIAGLEKAGERIRSAIIRIMVRKNRVSVLDVALIVLAGTVLGLVYNFASPSGIPVIPQVWRYPTTPHTTIEQTRALMEAQRIILVDARPAEFYKQRHISGALNLPPALFDFVYMMRFSQIDPQTPIVVYGRNISRHYDEEIAHRLAQRGHTKVSVMAGGLDAWQSRGLATTP